jgi:hypothetical protein
MNDTIEAKVVSREGNTIVARITTRAVFGEITIVKHEGGKGVFDASKHGEGDIIFVDLRSPNIGRPVH